ncbi:hypothetical protein POTOM_030279 [Populus tomentosa]|uniref:Uncharacterized protein n=1 Tax=Populus tomentosa TaxID=118781 RepID=A0A8X7Z6X5_POPTO|nr:hypothetical protein POTOM_030279 [Populus tomentosa]
MHREAETIAVIIDSAAEAANELQKHPVKFHNAYVYKLEHWIKFSRACDGAGNGRVVPLLVKNNCRKKLTGDKHEVFEMKSTWRTHALVGFFDLIFLLLYYLIRIVRTSPLKSLINNGSWARKKCLEWRCKCDDPGLFLSSKELMVSSICYEMACG